MFIINLTYKVSLDEVEKYLQDHVEYLKIQYEKKNFIASGRKNPRDGGVILSKLDSKDKLQEVLKKDPFYIEDLANYEIIEFFPTMTSEEFENLKEEIWKGNVDINTLLKKLKYSLEKETFLLLWFMIILKILSWKSIFMSFGKLYLKNKMIKGLE